MYIQDLKFSLWADFIERDYLKNQFQQLVASGTINGATSNPAIFKSAILNSFAYHQQLSSLQGTAKQKYEALAITDIQMAADILKPLYDENDDGYVSIEVDPNLCHDAQQTIDEGIRLFKEIDRLNVMIKIPATSAGYEAMEVLTSMGIPVNATLVFKKEQALACAKAFKQGASKASVVVDSVISIFVSRIDRLVDPICKAHNIAQGLTGIYNASLCYETVVDMQVPKCRPLFASTGVKENKYPSYYYVDELLAYNSINTAPIETIQAFVEHGSTIKKLPIDKIQIANHFDKLKAVGIDLEKELDQQIFDGLEAFKQAFREILEAI